MNWNHLETFVILSDNLSFSETAKVLNTAQPVISRQIKILEENFGHALFLRTKKSVALSPEGLELKRKLGPLVEEMKRVLLSERHDKSPLLKVEIRMGSMYEAGQLLVFPKIAQFIDEHPQAQVHLSLMSTSLVNEQVVKGIIDFGFVYELPSQKSVQAFAVSHDTPIMIGSTKMTSAWKKQESYSFIGYRENDLYLRRFLERNFTKAELAKVQYKSSVNSHDAIISLVQKRQGFAVIPQSSARKALEKGLIQVLEKDKKAQTLYIVCHEQVLIDKRKKAFLEYLIQAFKDAKS